MKLDGDDLETHYSHTLEELGKQPGLIGVIFRKAQNKIQDPAKLRRLIADLIDKEEWSPLDTDVKGDAYEGLLQKNAEDVKARRATLHAGPLIQAIDGCSRCQGCLRSGVWDGRFPTRGHDFIRRHHKLDSSFVFNTELLRAWSWWTGRAARCMNLVLHGIGAMRPCPSW